ncbi:MAG: glycosyltransferase family 1 protein [Myxococcales bacterium]|nr:MAG: glycosyltransferase family 1 protein [Myxococcales bacterium]
MSSPPLVLHVLPYDLPRGAQRYARDMRSRLDGLGAAHRTLCLFESSRVALHADFELSIRKTGLARLGLEPRALVALASKLAELRPAVVVAHGSEPLKYLAALPKRAKLVYYKIGVVHPKARAPLRRAAHAALLRRADVVAGVSQECLDEARDLFAVPERRLALIQNGRDPAVFRPAPKLSSLPALLFVGHVSASKRPGSFIATVRALREAGVECRALLIGDGPLLTDLSRDAAAANVTLLGARQDVPDLLRQGDVFVFTSVADGEGMPGVFIEAGLSGLPIVTTDVPGARSCVVDGVSGYVVPIDAPAQLTRRVRELLESPSLREAMGAAARAHCVQNFSLDSSVQAWSALLQRLLAT